MSITWHRGFKRVLSGVALSALAAGFVAFAAAPAHAADGPTLIEAPNFDNTTHVVDQWIFASGGARWMKALDDPAWSKDDVELITYARNGGRNQLWHFTRQQDRSYQIRNVHSGKCVTAYPAGPVTQADCNGRPQQHWTIKQVSYSPSWTANAYQFVNVSTRKALSQFGHPSTPKPFDPTANGAKVFQSKPNINDKYQFWKIVR